MDKLYEQAKVHLDRGELDQAWAALVRFLNGNFAHPEALFMLGGISLAKGNTGVATAFLRQALLMRPKFPEALLNLGSCFKVENDYPRAEKYWRLALEQEDLPGERAKILNNLGSLFVNEGCPEKSVSIFEEAISLDPSQAGPALNLGLAQLELGNWSEGWKGYERGWETGDRKARTYGKLPKWTGEPDRKVIVWGDQGVGDEIMFASMIPDMMMRCEKVILDCHPRLVSLFERSFPECEIHGTRKTLQGIDWITGTDADSHICLSSLGQFFRNSDQDFPGTPFLKAAPFSYERQRMRVGISWAGGTKKTRSDLRSIPLMQWEPLLKHLDADFFSLQYTPEASAEVCEFEEKTGIRVKHYPGQVQCRDYDKTASFVASMDLVITVNTTIHHIAGALGIPTWTLTPSKPAWRYGLTGERCPWYGSVRIIRQSPGETWAPVIQQVARELADFGKLQAA